MNYKQKVGRFGEVLACNYLIRRGYKIIEKNIKISYQELDIIARQQKKIIFVEVKTRASKILGPADEAISSQKIKSLKKAIEEYVYSKNITSKNIRLDLISIDIDRHKKIAKIKHYKDIF